MPYKNKEDIKLNKQLYYEKNKVHLNKQHRIRYIRNMFGISLEEYDNLKETQGTCGICGISFECVRACLDHNHDTGDVREFLCHRCNTAFGLLKENPKIIKSMLKYIDTWK